MNPCNDHWYEKFCTLIGEDNAEKVYKYFAERNFEFTGKGYMSYYERSQSRLSMLEGSKPQELKHRSRSWGYKFRVNNKKEIFSIRRNTNAVTEQ